MSAEDLLNQLRANGTAERAEQMRAYHKQTREVLGVPNGTLTDMARDIRRSCDLDERISLARGLWQSNIFEARILAAKIFEQARIRPDDDVWALIQTWMPEFDSWAIADHAAAAGQRRLVADPERLNAITEWAQHENMWVRRAALVFTLPWTKQRNVKPEERAAREQILDVAASYTTDHEWFIQKAVGWWLRELSKRDPDRTLAFLNAHGHAMKPFAQREAMRHINRTKA